MADCSVERLCETLNCNKAAKLQCPTCIKLNLQNSYFCSQECFKSNWNTHKVVHKTLGTEEKNDKGASITGINSSNTQIKDIAEDLTQRGKHDPWLYYTFSGKLRPVLAAIQSPMKTLPVHIGRPDYADRDDGHPIGEDAVRNSTHIQVLNDEEQECLRIACKLGREVLEEALKAADIGVTTEEIDDIVHEACVERECYPSPLNYYNFPKSCCTSVNEVICHGIPDKRPLVDGDILNVDVTVYHRGFHGDLNETVFIGDVSEKAKSLVRVASECLTNAVAMVKPGVKYREVGDVIQRHAAQHGYSVVRTFCGHGINRLFHTAPNVPHYAKNKAVGIMKPGHSFTIEPMISEGTWRATTWPDDWTTCTEDGKLSAQFENTLLVTEAGCDVLTGRVQNNGRPHFMDQLGL